MNSTPFRIAVLISGGGTTLENLIETHRRDQLNVEFGLVISNNPDAGGLTFAQDAGIENVVVNHRDFESSDEFSETIFSHIRNANIDLVVMGGFLRRLKIPHDFENKIINIHPSLIPSFSGKGHYGLRVHQAVLDYGCKLTGCTVHFVDDQYDHGPIIAQAAVDVHSDDDPKTLAARVFEKECKLYPEVINAIANGSLSIQQRLVTWKETS